MRGVREEVIARLLVLILVFFAVSLLSVNGCGL